MISFAAPLPAGNAVSILLAPPADAVAWKVLRKSADTISGEDDPDAATVFDEDSRFFVDVAALANGTPYYYQPFYRAADGSWSTAASVSVTPAASAEVRGPDALTLVRERLEAGLKVEVDAGVLKHDLGYIPCFTAPPKFEGVRFPIVTVHLTAQTPSQDAVGQVIASDSYDPIAESWTEYEGTIFSVQLQIVSWVTSNADIRIALRRAIAKVLLANLPVFYDQGLLQVEFSQTDLEDFETYEAEMFQTITNFSCLAPLAVESLAEPIRAVTLDATAP